MKKLVVTYTSVPINHRGQRIFHCIYELDYAIHPKCTKSLEKKRIPFVLDVLGRLLSKNPFHFVVDVTWVPHPLSHHSDYNINGASWQAGYDGNGAHRIPMILFIIGDVTK